MHLNSISPLMPARPIKLLFGKFSREMKFLIYAYYTVMVPPLTFRQQEGAGQYPGFLRLFSYFIFMKSLEVRNVA